MDNKTLQKVKTDKSDGLCGPARELVEVKDIFSIILCKVHVSKSLSESLVTQLKDTFPLNL